MFFQKPYPFLKANSSLPVCSIAPRKNAMSPALFSMRRSCRLRSFPSTESCLMPTPAHSTLLCPSNCLAPSFWLLGQELQIYSWLHSCNFGFILDHTLVTSDLFLTTLLSLPHLRFISKSCWIYTQTLSGIQSLHLSSAIITLVNMTASLFPAIFLLPLLATLPLPNVHCQITTRRLVRYQLAYTLCTNTFLKMFHLICNNIDA